METKVKILPHSEAEITGELSVPLFEAFRSRAVKNLSERISIQGFRKGHIPENIILSHVGETGVLEEMAEIALSKHYPDIVKEHALDVISRPAITLTKLARENPLQFTIRVALFPTLALPDYKAIAAEVRVAKDSGDEKVEEKKEGVKDGGAETEEQKKYREREKTRVKIIEAIAAKTEGEIPVVLAESELFRMTKQFKADIGKMGITIEEYLKHAKKTEEELRKEWLPEAYKRVRINILLREIAKKENIAPDPAAVEKEMGHVLEHYPEANREQARNYIYSMLANAKVLESLEAS